MESPQFIIVVGTSAGGINALQEFISHLQPDIDAAVFIVMHLSGTAISNFLIHHLQPHTVIPCEIAQHNAAIKNGVIYVAAANIHLLVKKNHIVLGSGPEENRWRPSIDVLFRSAAAAFNSRVIGVVLTGLLDDGTTGMLAIKRSGGTTIVQDPNEAEYPDMPLSVLNNMEVDYCVPLASMGEIITAIALTTPVEQQPPRDIIIESEISERVVVDYSHVKQLGEKSIYACPDCGGGLWEITNDENNRGKVVRYRCHIGHSYTEKGLVIKQGEIFEATLWTALRIMEERRNLLKKIAEDHAKRGFESLANDYKIKWQNMQVHVDKLKEVLFAGKSVAL